MSDWRNESLEELRASAEGLLDKSTATEHATFSSSTATEHATSSSSTATEHATFYAAATVSNDGVHLAENFAQWQPPAPGALRGKSRDIGETHLLY